MNILNSKIGNGKAATDLPNFFQQFVPIPGSVTGSVNIVAMPGTGIPMRDYFAAMALAGSWSAQEIESSREVAEWAYRVADAMIEARKAEPAKGFPYDDNKL